MLPFLTLLSLAPVLFAGDGARTRTADLRRLEEWIELEQSFTEAARAAAHAAVAAHLERGTELTDAAFYLEVRRIVALADNGHSNVDDTPIFERFGLVPLRTYWFSDGLFVVRARAEQRSLLGARIEGVEGRTLAELEDRLAALAGGTREYFRHYSAALLLLSPALMHAAGLAERPDRLRLALVDARGEPREVVLATDPDARAFRARPWRALNPRPIEGGADWAAFHASDVEPPLWLQEEDEPFRYVLLADGALAYVQLRGNRDAGGQRIRDFTARTVERLQQDEPRSIVLDNRQNGGGDLTTTADFALELPSFVQPGGRVYVLTGNGTFSAGIYTSYFPRASDPENTLVVGEPVGDRAEFWAEARGPFALPESGFGIGYALQRHDLLRGCTVLPECHMAQYPAHWNLVVATLAPDLEVPTTFADFAAGRDPVLERVLGEEAGRR
ncbi:MAG TPA: hypothetical protein VF530_14885 [Planctomycetota bacterium]